MKKDESGYNENGACLLCKKGRTIQGHDPCIADLPGVLFACCGHGVEDGYIKFVDGRVLNFTPVQMSVNKPETSIVVQSTPIPVFRNGEPETRFNFKTGKVKTKTKHLDDIVSVDGRPVQKRIKNK